MRILLTGATGFVGSVLLQRLMQEGVHDVCCLGRELHRIEYDIHKIDSTQSGWDAKVIAWQPDVVIHLAAKFTNNSESDAIEGLIITNILFTTQLVECISRLPKVKAFVNSGTFTEYMNGDGNLEPNNLYSATKSAVRPIISYYQNKGGWKWINIVIYSPYGKDNRNKKVLDYLKDALFSKHKIDFSPGYQVLDFIHVEDMADFYLKLCENIDIFPDGYTQLHLGSGRGHTLQEVGVIMEQVSGRKLNANWGGRPYNPEDPMHAVAPVSKMIKLLGWMPSIKIEDGIHKWLSNNELPGVIERGNFFRNVNLKIA